MASSIERAVAIVGLGAIMPDAPNGRAYWENIKNKRYSITEVPEDRWRAADYYDPDPLAPDKTYSKIGAWVRGFRFDWKSHRIPPKVAAAMDEGQQWAVSIAAEALADYGYPSRPLDTERTAVIIGTAIGGELHYRTALRIMSPEVARLLEDSESFRELPETSRRKVMDEWRSAIASTFPEITEDTMPGELPNVIAGRIANILNLRGPSFITDAACASSFAALASAAEMLAEHRCDAVMAGGVDRNMGPSSFVKFAKIGALSATGTRPFGDGADGFVMGEGAAMFLLKRLADAERDGDKIYAVIRGVGGASDGKGKGITAPNPLGQILCAQRAWEAAGLDPATATLLEAHGTSTKVGDVTEVESLSQVFAAAPKGSIALGSAKSNVGHLKAGAGAAGLLKAVYAVHDKLLPPTLNAERPNPSINFGATPFTVNHELREWRANGHPRRAGVSAYGFGGTNFHLVLEEHIPGMLKQDDSRIFTGQPVGSSNGKSQPALASPRTPAAPSNGSGHLPAARKPLQGILAVGGRDVTELKERLQAALDKARQGWQPPLQLPARADLLEHERVVLDFATSAELTERLEKSLKALNSGNPASWKPLMSQGVYRGTGAAPGKLAFLFPGQGSQTLNMARALAEREPVVAGILGEADRIMTPILGRSLTSYIFIGDKSPVAVEQAERELRQTAITQPSMLTVDAALQALLREFGFTPDYVMGHSLGEYAALVAAGAMPFAHALEAAAARGAEMTRVSAMDPGWMAAVIGPYEKVAATLPTIDGYVVAANLNSNNQTVIGGTSAAVQAAIDAFNKMGLKAMRIPVSHAFHTKIVEPAAAAMRQVLNRLSVSGPRIPVIANVNAQPYPLDPEAVRDTLEKQIYSPVRWADSLETAYSLGVRTFVEVGPKKVLKGFVDNVLANRDGLVSLFTNHPDFGEIAMFNQALCGLYAAGYGTAEANPASVTVIPQSATPSAPETVASAAAQPRPVEALQPTSAPETRMSAQNTEPLNALAQLLASALQTAPAAPKASDRNDPPLGSVVISGAGLGLPGIHKRFMDEDNALRILRGEQFIDLLPERVREAMVRKRITRLVKAEDGSGSFETIDDQADVVKLAGQRGAFDLSDEFGVPEKLVEALDLASQIAMAAGLDALREAGIPLVQTYKKTSVGSQLPDRWLLPEALRDETGVIFASAFPGLDRFSDELNRYYRWENRRQQIAAFEDVRQYIHDDRALYEIDRRIAELRDEMRREPYVFDRRFLFRVLSMGHSQFAEYIGARGPNTQVNAACASTAQAVGLAEDWIRSGRCRRVLVIAGDATTSDGLAEWLGAGFLSVGAAATEDRIAEAALPFDRRRHGMLMGIGSAALLVESEDALRERGMRGIVEVLSSETANSAFHGTRLDVDHIALVMERLLTGAERRFGINRYAIAPQTVFMSHETFTPARGGSAAAEVMALRRCFGVAADEIVVSNTKGFTGHTMAVGVEDVVAVKALEHGIVPPVPNFRDPDPELGVLNLSRGGRYGVQYGLRLAAGFGSQISMTLTRRIPGGPDRVDNKAQYGRWLADLSGYERAEVEVVKRTLRVVAQGAPCRLPAGSTWQYGTGPTVRAAAPGDGLAAAYRPAPMAAVARALNPQPTRVEPPAPFKIDMQPPAPVHPVAPVQPAVPTPVVPDKGTNGHDHAPVQAAPAEKPVTAAAPVAPAVTTKNTETTQEPVATSAPSAPSVPSGSSVVPSPAPVVDPVTSQVLAIVAGKTGYPQDMLDLELDLEADLGIDTVKQAETFAAIRDAFSIPVQQNLSLRDYPTLKSVVGFVYQFRPDLTTKNTETTKEPAAASVPSAPSVASVVPSPAPSVDPVTPKVLAIVADKTGYPQDMLDLELDLEADLGIDTVKQAETFAAIREAFGIPVLQNLSLRDYPTLKSVVGFVYQFRPDLTTENTETTKEPVAASVSSAPSAPSVVPSPVADPVTPTVLAIVADKTGYPQDMLDLELDLEADLGIDTVKQAETFAAIREAFSIPVQQNLSLRDYPTLKSVVGFVYQFRPDLTTENTETAKEPVATSVPSAPSVPSVVPSPAAPTHTIDAANRIPRRVPVPALRPAFNLCKPTGVTLGAGTRVVVMLDEGGIGKALISRLEKQGVAVLPLQPGIATADLDAQLKAWLADAPISGVYWLPALDVEPELDSLDLPAWREIHRRRTKNLYTTMRALYGSVAGPGAFLVAGTRLGGLHGYGEDGATAPAGGAVAGFCKAYAIEQGLRDAALTVKVVDFEPGRKTAEPAEQLIGETLYDPGVVEVGYRDGLRYSITLQEQPAGGSGQPLTTETVFVVTGAAGGITSAIVADLAQASRGIFYLLDLAALPSGAAERHVALLRQDRDALKRSLIDEARASGEKPTPAQIDRQIAAVERSEAALRALESVQAAGGTAYYQSCDLRDADAIAAIVAGIRQRYGRMDVLVHAGGLLVDRTLPNKEPAQFDLVFDVKADGLFNILKAAAGLPIGACVSFSSVAGRFGNNGQTDYSAANDLLCKLSCSFDRWRAGTRGIAIDWTAWGEIGMASRGAVPQVMAALGVDMLPPESGIPTVRRELTSNSRGEVLVAGRLGAWLEERDTSGGLDTEKMAAHLLQRTPRLPLVGKVTACKLYGGVEIETTLDPKVQPFLYDHAPDPETPWLPGVMATEALAEAASVLAPGYSVIAVENVQMHGAFKFFRMEPRTLHLSAVVTRSGGEELIARASLRSVTVPTVPGLPAQVKEHFTADVRLHVNAPAVEKVTFDPPATDFLDTCTDDIYKVFFHGPAYQVLQCAGVDTVEAVGVLPAQLPPDLAHASPNGHAVLMAPRLIESCFQVAAFWHIKKKNAMAFPLGFDSVTAYRPLEAASGRKLFAVVNTLDDGNTFDGRVIDEEGEVYVELRGYRTVSRPV